MTRTAPSVLFVCSKNGGKSQMAAALMRARGGVEVHSAGTRPGTALNAESVASLEELGLSVEGESPKSIDPDLLARVARVVVLDARRDLPGGFGPGPRVGTLGTWGQVLMHELGHTLGLDHPSGLDKAQIMFPETTYKEARWGAGDLAGLRRLGSASGCFPKAKASVAAPIRKTMTAGSDSRMRPGLGHVGGHGDDTGEAAAGSGPRRR